MLELKNKSLKCISIKILIFYTWFYKCVYIRRYLEDIFLKSMWFIVTLGTLDAKFLFAVHLCAENLYFYWKPDEKFSQMFCFYTQWVYIRLNDN